MRMMCSRFKIQSILRLIRQIQETQYQSFRGSPGVTDKELNRTEGGEQLFVRGVTNPHLHPWGSAEPAVLDATAAERLRTSREAKVDNLEECRKLPDIF